MGVTKVLECRIWNESQIMKSQGNNTETWRHGEEVVEEYEVGSVEYDGNGHGNVLVHSNIFFPPCAYLLIKGFLGVSNIIPLPLPPYPCHSLPVPITRKIHFSKTKMTKDQKCHCPDMVKAMNGDEWQIRG